MEVESIIERTGSLPYELRAHIYSYTYTIDVNNLDALWFKLEYTRKYEFPPRNDFLKEPAYINVRLKHDAMHSTFWTDSVETAFHNGKVSFFRVPWHLKFTLLSMRTVRASYQTSTPRKHKPRSIHRR